MSYRVKKMDPFGVIVEPETVGTSVTSLPIATLRDLARECSLLLLRGFATFRTAEEFSDYCGLWGEISLWPFGKVLELVEQKNPQDHIFDNNYVPLHWDGMYRPQVPEFQVFHCVSAPEIGEGGRTTFSNTTVALARAHSDLIREWKRVTGVYHRKMEFYDSKTVAPIVASHPVRGFPVIRYNEPPKQGDTSFVNHPELVFNGIDSSRLNAFHEGLQQALYAPENFYAHAWMTGDLVVSDNYTLLHGREGFRTGAARHLRRVHVLGDPPLNNPHLVSHA